MRIFRIFTLHFQDAFQERSRAFIFFLISLINPFIYLLFWNSAFSPGSEARIQWGLPQVTTYYFLLLSASVFLMAHIEEDVAIYDIQEGGLSKYLLRPFSYYWLKFFEELPWRIIQGIFGIAVLLVIRVLFGNFFLINGDNRILLMATPLFLIAYLLSFTFKITLGLTAFWLTDYRGLKHVFEVLIILFAGYVLPLSLMPSAVENIAYMSPFPYMIYLPVAAIQGALSSKEVLQAIEGSLVWLVVLSLLYKLMWKKGVHRYFGVGQ